MKHFKTVLVHHDKQVLTHRTCDICGSESYDGSNWSDKTFGVEEITILRKTGESYPDCGTMTDWSFDLCPSCWTEKLVPWMKEQGAFPEEKDIGW